MREVGIALVWRGGLLLVARRPDDAHLGGLWEFPGGKMEPGESPEACAEREVFEELGLRCRARGRREAIRWEYADRTVVLHPVDCEATDGDARAMTARTVEWIAPDSLPRYPMPAANAGLVATLMAQPRHDA